MGRRQARNYAESVVSPSGVAHDERAGGAFRRGGSQLHTRHHRQNGRPLSALGPQCIFGIPQQACGAANAIGGVAKRVLTQPWQMLAERPSEERVHRVRAA